MRRPPEQLPRSRSPRVQFGCHQKPHSAVDALDFEALFRKPRERANPAVPGACSVPARRAPATLTNATVGAVPWRFVRDRTVVRSHPDRANPWPEGHAVLRSAHACAGTLASAQSLVVYVPALAERDSSTATPRGLAQLPFASASPPSSFPLSRYSSRRSPCSFIFRWSVAASTSACFAERLIPPRYLRSTRAR